MPEWFKIPAIVLATGAAVIASQALISGSFTIFSEAINLNFWPRLRIKYPSTLKGQLYVPAVNMLLFVGCMLTLFIFRTSSHMEAAYGLAITLTMLMTTVLLAFYLHHKGCGAVVVTLFSIVFFSIEGVFFTSNLFKFVHGGWYSITFALIVLIVMLGWYISTKIRDRYFIYERVDAYLPVIKAIKEDDSIPYFAANAVFLSHSPNAHDVEAKLIYSIINKSPKRAQHYWLLRIEQTDEPDALTYTVDELIPGTLFSIGLRIGF